MNEITVFQVEDKFSITGRGIVLVGNIDNETGIRAGDYIQLICSEEIILSKIVGIEIIRYASLLNTDLNTIKNNKIGILIEKNHNDIIMNTDFQGKKYSVFRN